MQQKSDDPNNYIAYFNKVYDETFDEVKRYVARKCSDPFYIQDILQEAYCEYYKLMLKKGESYLRNERAVIFKIAKRRVFRYYSLKQKLSHLIPLFQTDTDGEEYCILDTLDSNEGIFSDEVLSSIEAQRIWSIINTYPADTRKIMQLYFGEGMSHSQIADEVGCSLSNVKNKLYRTLSEIKEKEKDRE